MSELSDSSTPSVPPSPAASPETASPASPDAGQGAQNALGQLGESVGAISPSVLDEVLSALDDVEYRPLKRRSRPGGGDYTPQWVTALSPEALQKDRAQWTTKASSFTTIYVDNDVPSLSKASSKPTPMPTPPSPAQGSSIQTKDTPLESRRSLFNNTYPRAKESHWVWYEGAGWVHIPTEAAAFKDAYCQCALTKRWFDRRSEHHQKLTQNRIALTTAIADAVRKGTLTQCSFSSYYTEVEDTIQARGGDDTYVPVSRWALANHGGVLAKCDYSGRTDYMPQALITIKGSSQYKRVCRSAAESHFARCGSCGGHFEKGMVKTRNGTGTTKALCEDCYYPYLKKAAILPHNAKDYPDPLVSEVTRLGHRIGEDGLVYATHQRQTVPIHRLFGVEVETEMHQPGIKRAGVTRLEVAIEVRQTLGHDFCIIKEDGTLTTNGKYSDDGDGRYFAGFEIVSAPADIAIQRERWLRLLHSKWYKHLRAWDTKTCGFHVHVSKASLTNLQIGRILVFINSPHNQEFVARVAGRGSDVYCRYLAKQLTDPLHPERVISPEEQEERNRTRRVAVNISNPRTVEFRIFRGTINPHHMIRNIEFVDAVCDFCYPAARSLRDFGGHRAFVRFVKEHSKKWPRLAEWMASPKVGFIKAREIPASGVSAEALARRTLKPELVEEAEIPSVMMEVKPRDSDTSVVEALAALKTLPKRRRGIVVTGGAGEVVYSMPDTVPDPFSTAVLSVPRPAGQLRGSGLRHFDVPLGEATIEPTLDSASAPAPELADEEDDDDLEGN